MKTTIGLFGAAALLAIIGWALSTHVSPKPQISSALPVDIYFSENNGTAANTRSWSLELVRDQAGSVSASYALKDAAGAQRVHKDVPLSPQTFEDIFAAAQKIPPMQPVEPCFGGGGKELDVTVGSTTTSSFSLNCGPTTVNQGLEAFYARYLSPLMAGLPTT